MKTRGDDDFVRSFEACTLPPGSFHHRDHVRLAWLLLGEESLPAALARFRDGLRRYAASLGKGGLYHETITFAYLLLVHERRLDAPAAETFEAFAERNPDLFAWPRSVLERYYRRETLGSERARRAYVLPDRLLAREAPQLEDEAGGADGEGGGHEQVGQGHEQGEEAQESEAEGLRPPQALEA